MIKTSLITLSIKTLLITNLFLSCYNTYSQTSGVTRQHQGTLYTFQKIKKLLNEKEKEYSIEIENIKGSPYLNDNFSLGKLYISDSLIDTNLFRYNIYSDEIEVTENDQLYGLLKISNTRLLLNKQEITLQKYTNNDGIEEKGYFIVLSAGEKLKLFLRKKCKLTPAQKATTPNEMDRAAKFNRYEEYYIKIKGASSITKLKIKKKEILNLMNDKKEKINKYINDHKINIKNKEKLTNLVNYYNSL